MSSKERKKQRHITRLVVFRNNRPLALAKVDGLPVGDILLPARDGQYLGDRCARFTTEDRDDAINNTRHAERTLREAICAEYVRAKAPELESLYVGGEFQIKQVSFINTPKDEEDDL
jgi:hypothetical protein